MDRSSQTHATVTERRSVPRHALEAHVRILLIHLGLPDDYTGPLHLHLNRGGITAVKAEVNLLER